MSPSRERHCVRHAFERERRRAATRPGSECPVGDHCDAATGARRARKPTPHRSRTSCRRRRVSAIAFAGKESSDTDDPNDHSVADPIAARGGPAIAIRGLRSSANAEAERCYHAIAEGSCVLAQTAKHK
jgi:hypothetical protein